MPSLPTACVNEWAHSPAAAQEAPAERADKGKVPVPEEQNLMTRVKGRQRQAARALPAASAAHDHGP